jgi:hypothetical protein
MENLKLVFLIFDEGVRPDIMEVLDKHGIKGWTTWRNNSGNGEGGPKQGTAIWPGLNDVIMMAIEEEKVQPIIDDVHEVQDSFPVRPGIRFIVTDAQFC